MRKLQVRRGSSFVWTATYKRDGIAQSVDAITIASQIRDEAATLLATLTIAKLAGQTGKFTLSGNSAGWAPGTYYCDVKYTNGAEVAYTDRFIVEVLRSETA